ncbi:LysR family transcriptional regulator [Robbsia sp. Bb-Pol-6]|uniref:LysR family transcriptional regulator n=1 Tax=Robbsia betulipollinis TaxID=2981849 RepID=A0ABT3ZSN8_9BURK|nr:LysR family transcriptional regulator [Robbsia betulipollinis]MCY0389556.1 LysR family transcriptional regulator [Robbsia betulipollinis]
MHEDRNKPTLDVLMSRLRMKQLQLLIALDDHASLHKASSAMAMTQSAASKALAELEAMLGEPLFERMKTGLVPNPFGHCVIRYARLLASELDALCQEVADIRAGTGGRLAVGAIMGSILDRVAPVLNDLRKRHPGLSIEIVEDTSSRMLVLLDEGRLDLVIGRSAVSDSPGKYRYHPLADEPVAVVVGADHPPFAPGEVTFAELAQHRWVSYPNNMPMQAFLEREMDLAGMPMPDSAISTASTFVTVALLRGDVDLVALLPEAVAQMFSAHGMLRVVPVAFKSQSQTFGIVTRKAGMPSPLASEFIERLKAQVARGIPMRGP